MNARQVKPKAVEPKTVEPKVRKPIVTKQELTNKIAELESSITILQNARKNWSNETARLEGLNTELSAKLAILSLEYDECEEDYVRQRSISLVCFAIIGIAAGVNLYRALVG